MNQRAFTRRRFLGTSLALVSTAASVPAFLHQAALADEVDPSAATRSRPGVPEDRILVVVQLSGGNDGLNTVIPYGASAYYDARPTLAIAPDQVLKLDAATGIGVHPQLGALKQMIEEGQASIVQGVGYPNPNRSHFASMDIWHTADPAGGRGLGWVGRGLDQVEQRDGCICVAVGREAPLATHGRRTRAVTFESANLFRWSGGDLHPALPGAYDQANRAGVLTSAADGSDQAAFLMRTALDAQVASDRIRSAVARGSLTEFPRSSLGEQLRMVAAMIRAELPTRVYYVGMGGFDTHAGQPYPHGRNLADFAGAMRAFYAELKAMGQQDRVLGLAFSEFGRRVHQNASNGTDHGTAGPSFLFGPMVKPGLLGEHPSLTQLDDGDLVHTVDFRNLYATVLDQWLKLDSQKVLGRGFKHANLLV